MRLLFLLMLALMLAGCQEAIVEEVPEVVEEIEEIEVAEPVVEEVCIPNWVCGDYGSCSDLEKSRTCADANSCGVDTDKPVESESCVACGDGICSVGEDYYLCSGDCPGVKSVIENASYEDLLPETFGETIPVKGKEVEEKDRFGTKSTLMRYEIDTNVANQRADIVDLYILEGTSYTSFKRRTYEFHNNDLWVDDDGEEFTYPRISSHKSYQDVGYIVSRFHDAKNQFSSDALTYCKEYDKYTAGSNDWEGGNGFVSIDLEEQERLLVFWFYDCVDLWTINKIIPEYLESIE